MKTFIVSTICASVLALAGVSQAGQISSPTIFGSGDAVAAECVVYNGGTNAVAMTVKIIDDFAQTIKTSNCGGPVGAGQFCSVFTPIDGAEAHACIVATPGSSTNLRGALVHFKRVGPDDFDLFHFHAIRSAALR